MSKEIYRKRYKEYSNRVITTKVILSVASNADNIIAAAFISSVVLASLALLMPLIIFVIALAVLFSSGLGSYVGYLLGKGNKEEANDFASYTMIVITIIAIAIATITSAFAGSIATLLGATGKYNEVATTYLRIIGISFMPQIIAIVLDKLILNDGAPKFTFYVNIASMFVNLGLNVIFVIGFSMGVNGLALATLISHIVHLGVDIYYFLHRSKVVKFVFPKNHIRAFFEIIYNGASDFLSVFTDAIMIYVVNKSILKFLPHNYLEAFAVATLFTVYITKIYVGSQVGLQPITSQLFGKAHFKELKGMFTYSLKRSLVYGIVMYLLLIPVAYFLLPYLLDDKALIPIAFRMYIGVGIAFIGSCVGIQVILFYTAINRPVESLVIAALRTLVLIPVSSFMMIYLFKVDGIAIGFLLPEVIITSVFFVFFRRMDIAKYRLVNHS